MILTNSLWDIPIVMDKEGPIIIIIPDINELFLFNKMLNNQLEATADNITLVEIDKPINFTKEVEVITNPFFITLNTRKTINFLHKELESQIKKSDLLFAFERVRQDLNILINEVRKETLLDFKHSNDYSFSQLLKLLDVAFTEREENLSTFMIKYLDIITTINKVKVLFINLAFYLLGENEVFEILHYCKLKNIFVIFIEKSKPITGSIFKSVLIANNCVLI